MDTGKVDIKVFKSEGETPSGIAAKTSKEQADLLKEKYKDFKKKERTKDAKEG